MAISGIYKDHRPVSKLLVFIGLFLTGFGLSTVLGILSMQFIFDIDIIQNPSLLRDFENTNTVAALKVMQFFNSLGIFIFPVLVFSVMTTSDYKKYLSIKVVPSVLYILLTAIIMIVSLPLINYMVELNAQMKLPDFLSSVEEWMREKENNAEIITQSFLTMEDTWSFVVNLFLIGLIPAFGEELLFRGFLQKQLAFKMNNSHLAIWIAAFLFSAMHMQFYGFIPRLLLGVVFGYLFLWSGSLWIPILAHFINNAGAVSVQYIFGTEFTEENIDTIGSSSDNWAVLISSLLVVFFAMNTFWKKRVQI